MLHRTAPSADTFKTGFTPEILEKYFFVGVSTGLCFNLGAAHNHLRIRMSTHSMYLSRLISLFNVESLYVGVLEFREEC